MTAPDPQVAAAIRRFILLAELATDLCLRHWGGERIGDAWKNGGVGFRLVAVNRQLGCKRHGTGAIYLIRGALRDYAGCAEISLDYDRLGRIVIQPWHLRVFLAELFGAAPELSMVRDMAGHMVAGRDDIMVAGAA